MSETQRAHINAVVPVNGKNGLWRMFIRDVADVPRSTFRNVLHRYLGDKGFKGGLERAHVDHNVCPTCRELKYKVERNELSVRETTRELQRILVGTDGSDEYDALQARLNELRAESARLAAEKRSHAQFNAHCRSVIAWWRNKAIDALGANEGVEREESPARSSVPEICIVHCDGEAGRKIPHARLDSDGGGFEGRNVKNVAFADMATGETHNFFLPDFVRTESTSTLIDMVLRRALMCRGEKVFVLVLDCCSSNYNGVLWAFCVFLVDELAWFEAVVVEYMMPRHGKGDADKVFGGHRHTWKYSDVLCEDQLGQAYCDASSGKENVSILMPSALCDWKEFFTRRTNGRVSKYFAVRTLVHSNYA